MRAGRLSAILAFAAVAASGPALLAPAAGALEPGVHVDPGSPAAKEYALPVSKARGSGGSEGAHERLFGAGISPPSSGSSGGGAGASGGEARGDVGSPRAGSRAAGTGAARKRSAGAHGTPAGTGTGAATGAASQVPPALVRRVADGRSSSGGGSSSLVLLGGGVAVIVLGAFAGIVLRHGRGPASVGERSGPRDAPRRV
jgi:hypothetical protein